MSYEDMYLRNSSCTFTDMKRTSAGGGGEGAYISGCGQTSPEIRSKGTNGSKERTGILRKLLGFAKSGAKTKATLFPVRSIENPI